MNDFVEAAALDDAHPWPGLVSFTEASSPYFFGRAAEEDELFRRVQRETTTLLFGQSGLGKTSLVQASLIPRLRENGYTPFLLRLDHGEKAPPASEQVASAMTQALAGATVKAPPMAKGEGLWEYLHRRDLHPEGGSADEIQPVLILDQFEEVFTLGLATDAQRARAQAFLIDLADLIENRRPARLSARFEADPDLMETFALGRQDYRIVVSMREDYLPQLESVRARAPSLGANRFRLTRMNGKQALEAVTGPGGALVSDAVAREIVRFVGSRRIDDPFGLAPGGARDELAELEVEPSMLSLFCQQLNEKRLDAKLPQITQQLLEANRESILEAFYERAFADQPAALRTFVEDQLLTDSGVRCDVTRERAEEQLTALGVAGARAAIDELVRRRILHVEDRLNVPRIELIHDVLAEVVARSRSERRARDTQAALERQVAEARGREEALRASFAARRRRLMLVAGVAALAVVSATLAISYASVQTAYSRLAVADTQLRTQAKALRDSNEFAQYYLTQLKGAMAKQGGAADSHLVKSIEIAQQRLTRSVGASSYKSDEYQQQQNTAMAELSKARAAEGNGPEAKTGSHLVKTLPFEQQTAALATQETRATEAKASVSGPKVIASGQSGAALAATFASTDSRRDIAKACDPARLRAASGDEPSSDVASDESVIRCLTGIIAAKPDDARAYVDRAGAYIAQQKYELALADTTKALGISADLAPALIQLGDYYRHGWAEPEDLDRARQYYLQAANAGDARGQYDMAWLYANGRGVPKDMSQAFAWLSKAAAQNLADAETSLGVLYSNGDGVKQDYGQALAWFKRAAAQGDPLAEANLGVMYQYAEGVPQDYAEALSWYRKAADQGNAVAQDDLGLLYKTGRGTAQDYAQAMTWFRKAADQGNTNAQNDVAYLYEDGQGVPRDYAQALNWFHKAADQGDPEGEDNVGIIYAYGRGVPVDQMEALRWFRMAAMQGYADAEDNLGLMYDLGHGVAQDSKEAIVWYLKAAAQGNADAEDNLGSHYDAGDGVNQDYAVAMSWYLKAAEKGDSDAEKRIGYLYDAGDGVPKDYGLAMEWYKKAAAQGNSSAENNIGALYENGHGVTQDYAQALSWYMKAAADGNNHAEANIAYFYEHGQGVPADLEKARAWYHKAAADGNDDAQKWLADHSTNPPPPPPPKPAKGATKT